MSWLDDTATEHEAPDSPRHGHEAQPSPWALNPRATLPLGHDLAGEIPDEVVAAFEAERRARSGT